MILVLIIIFLSIIFLLAVGFILYYFCYYKKKKANNQNFNIVNSNRNIDIKSNNSDNIELSKRVNSIENVINKDKEIPNEFKIVNYFRHHLAKMAYLKNQKKNSIDVKIDEDEKILCPICQDYLKREYAKDFKCSKHWGHIDCIKNYNLIQEDYFKKKNFLCPYNCK